jgi:hypothetical protein
MEPPEWNPSEGPWFAAGAWRNGREAGAWAAGICHGLEGQRVHVMFGTDHVDGAVTSLIAAHVTIRPFSGDDATRTLELWYNG